MRFGLPAFIGSVAVLATSSCGGPDSPLGGPYGGTWEPPGPTSGSSGGSSGGTSGSSSGSSSGGAKSGSGGGSAATWSSIFSNYLESACTNCHEHTSNMASATKSYSYLQGLGYIDGTSSSLVSPSESILTWVSSGGFMPPSGGTNPQAMADLDAWAAAGAQDN